MMPLNEVKVCISRRFMTRHVCRDSLNPCDINFSALACENERQTKKLCTRACRPPLRRAPTSTLCPERMTSGDARFFQTQRKGISFVCGTNPHQLTRCQGEIAEWRAELKRIDLGVQKQTIKKGKYQSDINERVIERLS